MSERQVPEGSIRIVTVDPGGLIAEARERVRAHDGFVRRTFGYKPMLSELYAQHGELADALESTLAELRQERERADDLYAANVGLVDAMYATDAALSRAEETIERVKLARSNHPQCDRHDADDPVTCGWKHAVQDIDAALTEYDKTKKEADHG